MDIDSLTIYTTTIYLQYTVRRRSFCSLFRFYCLFIIVFRIFSSFVFSFSLFIVYVQTEMVMSSLDDVAVLVVY